MLASWAPLVPQADLVSPMEPLLPAIFVSQAEFAALASLASPTRRAAPAKLVSTAKIALLVRLAAQAKPASPVPASLESFFLVTPASLQMTTSALKPQRAVALRAALGQVRPALAKAPPSGSQGTMGSRAPQGQLRELQLAMWLHIQMASAVAVVGVACVVAPAEAAEHLLLAGQSPIFASA